IFQNLLGFRYVVLESLRAKPRTWVILLPDNLDTAASDVQAFLFFRPESANVYSSQADVKFRDATAILDGVYHQPRHLQPTPHGPLEYNRFPVLAAPDQLRASGKKVAFLFPLPHGTKPVPSGVHFADFGALLKGGEGMPMVGASLLALWQEEILT